jgi:hypothetical protein
LTFFGGPFTSQSETVLFDVGRQVILNGSSAGIVAGIVFMVNGFWAATRAAKAP